MVLTNESTRTKIEKHTHDYLGINAINSNLKIKEKCSWACHDNTFFCKENHVKLVSSHFKKIDPIYFGLIGILKGTGKYDWANVLILVILMPLVMYYLIVKSLDMEVEIRAKKRG